MENTIHIYRSRQRTLMMLGLFLLLTGISVALLFHRNFEAPVWVLVGLFGIGSLAVLSQWLDKKPRVSLSEQGVQTPYFQTPVAWEIIQDAEAKRMGRSTYILLHTTEDEAWLAEMSKSTMRMMQSVGSRKYVFNAHNLDQTPGAIAKLILELAQLSPEERNQRIRQQATAQA